MKHKHIVTQPMSYENNLYHGITRFCNDMLTRVNNRKLTLKSALHSSKVISMTKHAGRFAGRRPSLHAESGLIERVRARGFGNKIKQFSTPEVTAFQASLDAAEKLMQLEPTFTGDKRLLVAATKRVFEACDFPKSKFRPSTIDYAAHNQLNLSSSGGHPEFQRKGLILDLLKEQATKCLYSGWFEPFYWPITRGFRIQIRKLLMDLALKIRVMYPYPGVITLLECTFALPFVEHFISNTSFYVIGKNGLEISKTIRKKFEKVKGRITTTDISAFDQRVLNEFSIAAFSILRMQLQLNKKEDAVFKQIVAYFCCSYAVSKVPGKPAYCFVKTTGVPSGSGFTNMVDTLVHAIALEYCEPGILAKETTLVCGDDVLFDTSLINLQDFTNKMLVICNLPIQWEKSKHFLSWRRVSFLGFDWIDGVRFQDEFLLINQLIWHSDFRTDLSKVERELSRGASILLNAQNGSTLFRKLFPDVIEHLEMGVDVKFYYMHGAQPPTTLPGVLGYIKPDNIHYTVPSSNVSLSDHLDHGWKIR